MNPLFSTRLRRALKTLPGLAALAFLAANSFAAQGGKTLAICYDASPEGFDTARALTSATYNAVFDPLYNTLVGFAPDSLKVVPELAERWEQGKDGRQFTFYLRRGVQWHNTAYFKPTRELNADDVVLSLERFRNREHAFNKAYGWSEYAYNKHYAENIEKVEKLDDYTVRIHLKLPDASFLPSLGMPTSIIISAEYAGQLQKSGRAAEINTRPVGTGPFLFRRYDKDAQIRYDAHPGHFRGRPGIGQLVYVIAKDSAVRLQKLKTGECHLSVSPKPQEITAAQSDPRLKVVKTEGFHPGFLAFNTQKPPLDKAKVRQALSLAINKQALAASVFQQSADSATTLISPGMVGYDPAVKAIAYDPKRARELLTEAGYPQGFALELWALPIPRAYIPDARKFSEIVQADWAKIGVQTRIVSYDWGEFLKRVHAGEHQALTLGWFSDNGDPDNLLPNLLSCARQGGSLTRWCNPEFEKLLEQGRHETQAARRHAVYLEASRLLQRELPLLPVSYGKIFVPLRKEVQGFQVSLLGRLLLHKVRLEKP
jgi:dipeptide transport system substrate-binding protein